MCYSVGAGPGSQTGTLEVGLAEAKFGWLAARRAARVAQFEDGIEVTGEFGGKMAGEASERMALATKRAEVGTLTWHGLPGRTRGLCLANVGEQPTFDFGRWVDFGVYSG